MGKISFLNIQNYCLSHFNFKLQKCEHSDKLKIVLIKFLVQMVAVKHVKDINRIITGKDLRPLKTNAANIFVEAKELHDKKMKKKVRS